MIEIWILYSLLAAIFTAGAVLTEKKILKKEHAMEFSAVLATTVLFLSIPFFFFIDYSKLQLIPILLLLLASIISGTGFILVAKSIRHMQVSEAMPLASLSPAVVTILALIFLNEIPTLSQTIGIALLIVGAFVLESKGLKISKTLKILKKSKYIHYIFIALLLYGIAALFDRIILHTYQMQTIAFIGFAHVFIALYFLIMLSFFYDGTKGIKRGFKKSGRFILLTAIFVIGYRFAQSEAIKIANVGLVISIKRLSTLLVVFIAGEIFHEGKIIKKILASIIMIAGAILISTS